MWNIQILHDRMSALVSMMIPEHGVAHSCLQVVIKLCVMVQSSLPSVLDIVRH